MSVLRARTQISCETGMLYAKEYPQSPIAAECSQRTYRTGSD